MVLQVFVNGPPGAGKTTLCKLLCAELRLEQLSTGDLLKDNIAQRTELGRAAKQCIASRTLVPDHVVVDMVAEKVLECSLRGQGWVLDGFPRTVEQSAALRRKMIAPSVAIVLELSERACAQRITGRRFDSASGAIYHLPNLPPRDAAVLARLTKRGDDTAAKLPPRFEAYRAYGEKTNAEFSAIAHRIDASVKTPEELLEDVLTLLHSIRPTNSSHSGSSGASYDSMVGNAGLTLRGNQHPSSGLVPVPAVTSLSKQPKTHVAPQRIEEEDDEDEDELSVGIEEMISYDCDDDDAVAVSSSKQQQQQQQPSRPKSAELEPQSPLESVSANQMKMSGSSSSTISSSNSNNNEELPSSSAEVVVAVGRSATALASSSLTASPAATPTVVNGVDMTVFKDMLLDGFEVLKHGRRGSPHMRLIFTDMDFKRIFWQKVTKGSKTKKPKLDQSLVLADVMQVVRGMKTEVLKRSGDVSKYERYISLVADDRTLDMELADDAACDFLLRGFDVLLHGGQ